MTKFSVIIAARGISDFLKESIRELKKLDYANFDVVIVTDNHETFDFAGDNRFVLLDSKGDSNPGFKRNLGAQRATGEILAFLDDDAYPVKDWLTMAETIFNDPRVYAVGGPAVTPLNSPFEEKVSGAIVKSFLASGQTTYRHKPQSVRYIDDYPTVNLLVRKTAFEAVGGFGVEFWPGEDTKLCLDLVKYFGRKFMYSPEPVVYHHRRKVFKPHLKQISRYGRHRGQYARIFPETSRQLSYFIPSLFVTGLFLGPLTYFVIKPLFTVYLLVLMLYLLLVVIEGLRASQEERNPLMIFFFGLGIILTHIVYGLNFMVGYLKRPKFRPKSIDTASGNYNEG